MEAILIRWLVNAVALFAAVRLVSGIQAVDRVETFFIVAAIFGLVNALIRPVLKVLTCPLIVLTLGLFTLVINALMLLLTSWLAQRFGIGFRVAGFWPGLWGALVISLVSIAFNLIIREENR